MGATWVIGDLHGCAVELSLLLKEIAPAPDDRLFALGDLFHRGPDPAGVLDLMREHRIEFILGNHEQRVLERFFLAPRRADASDRPPKRPSFPSLTREDLAGDGRRPLLAPSERLAEILTFLQSHRGYFQESKDLEGAGPTKDGRPFCLVHAGLLPGHRPSTLLPDDLTSLRRLDLPGRPFWYEVYGGPNLVLFGHTPSTIPRQCFHQGHLVAAGLDTGCVYGGSLTAYSPELDTFTSVPCQRPGGYAQP